ncbi:MAG: TldD/PmbA family protein [Oligoflexia bacterium]|nr:TldD/PmbA family protein [Oligoflexia bacterium]
MLEQNNPEQFEIYFQRRTSTRIDAKQQQIDSLSRSEDVGMAVRVIKDRKQGFSFTTSLNRPAIERMVKSALDIAAVMPEDDFAGLPVFSTFVYPEVDAWDSKGILVPMNRKVEMAKELEAACRTADSRIQGIRSAVISESLGEVHLMDSSGDHIHHHGTVYGASISCKAEQNGDNQVGGDMQYVNFLDLLNIKSVGTVAAERATELLNAGDAPTMSCPAVFRNSVVVDLIDFLSSSFSAEEIEKGRSMLAGKDGQHLFSEHITLIDDGLLAGGLASSPFDAEGCPSQKTILIDRGFVAGTLYDTYHARKAGKASTGNASRGIKSLPEISTTNLFMQPGRRTQEQLLDGISKGVLITHLMGLHTANAVTGDFSLGASGILIENGKLTRPVRGFAVAGNVLELLRKVTDVGNDLRFFGSVGAPSVRISEISVAGK